eukprot:CAMPEP_0179489536 /NCGR_PEP_ID=MMETSP0799-20121207/64892_1 /TAXON_ID=46947 /ORGANISM="Geminigera cryophila, Strain CCMP2564" /LENGTH=109 /DNA_ID=CAMNT_0021305497 /DNA_START=87 /DNA_END=413 /DNA_ORIENTATION=-
MEKEAPGVVVRVESKGGKPHTSVETVSQDGTLTGEAQEEPTKHVLLDWCAQICEEIFQTAVDTSVYAQITGVYLSPVGTHSIYSWITGADHPASSWQSRAEESIVREDG